MREQMELDREFCALLRTSLKLEKFFKDKLTTENVRMLFPASGLYSYDKDDFILRQGEESKDLYVVRSGKVAITRIEGTAGAQLATLGPGEIFGEMALFGKEGRSATIRAMTEVRLFRIKREYFEKLMDEDHELALKLYRRITRILTDRLQQTTERLAVANRIIRAASQKR